MRLGGREENWDVYRCTLCKQGLCVVVLRHVYLTCDNMSICIITLNKICLVMCCVHITIYPPYKFSASDGGHESWQ